MTHLYYPSGETKPLPPVTRVYTQGMRSSLGKPLHPHSFQSYVPLPLLFSALLFRITLLTPYLQLILHRGFYTAPLFMTLEAWGHKHPSFYLYFYFFLKPVGWKKWCIHPSTFSPRYNLKIALGTRPHYTPATLYRGAAKNNLLWMFSGPVYLLLLKC